jgi:hypothetical protein
MTTPKPIQAASAPRMELVLQIESASRPTPLRFHTRGLRGSIGAGEVLQFHEYAGAYRLATAKLLIYFAYLQRSGEPVRISMSLELEPGVTVGDLVKANLFRHGNPKLRMLLGIPRDAASDKDNVWRLWIPQAEFEKGAAVHPWKAVFVENGDFIEVRSELLRFQFIAIRTGERTLDAADLAPIIKDLLTPQANAPSAQPEVPTKKLSEDGFVNHYEMYWTLRQYVLTNRTRLSIEEPVKIIEYAALNAWLLLEALATCGIPTQLYVLHPKHLSRASERAMALMLEQSYLPIWSRNVHMRNSRLEVFYRRADPLPQRLVIPNHCACFSSEDPVKLADGRTINYSHLSPVQVVLPGKGKKDSYTPAVRRVQSNIEEFGHDKPDTTLAKFVDRTNEELDLHCASARERLLGARHRSSRPPKRAS